MLIFAKRVTYKNIGVGNLKKILNSNNFAGQTIFIVFTCYQLLDSEVYMQVTLNTLSRSFSSAIGGAFASAI